MKEYRLARAGQREAGIALLISIFILLLISVVAIALIVSSGTESALAGNYRSSTAVYYASLSGLEEARSRLLAKNPSSFNKTQPGFVPSPGVTMAVGSVAYVLNPSPNPAFGENLGNLLALYPDAEYDNEFGPGALAAANVAGTVQTAPSVWNTGPLNAVNGAMGGPFFKWVRINPVSEISLNLDVDADGRVDSLTPIYYNGTSFSNSAGAGPQVFEITSLAVLPDRSRKLLQYLVTANSINMPPFPAAMTLAGSATSSVVSYTAPSSNGGFQMLGLDQDCNRNPTGLTVRAIGVFNSADTPVVINGIPAGAIRNNNYQGVAPSPDVFVVYPSFSPGMTTPSGLNSLVQTIIANADATVPVGSASAQQSYLTSLLTSSQMSTSSPITVVVNGDLDLTGWHNTGFGLLLVTGKLNYDPDATWEGIVMVVGKGIVTGSRSGSGEFDGALFVAQTLDPSTGFATLLPDPNLGHSSVNFNAGSSMGGNGVRYSNCWIQRSLPSAGFKILSFHEIAQ